MSAVGYSKISLAIFAFSFIIAMISLLSVVFPALISETVTVSELEKMGIALYEEDPFQIGPTTSLLVITNVIIFGTYFLNRKISLVSKLFKKLFNFQVSKKISVITIIILLSVYVTATSPELETEEEWEDFAKLKLQLEDWKPLQTFRDVQPHVKYFLSTSSLLLFDNYKVIPFLASIILLLVTYLFTTTITKNRFAGLVSMSLVLQSNLFLSFDTSITYSNFWVLFYLLSLYFVIRIWFVSPIFFGLSIFSKALTAVFSPMSIFFILNSDISRNQKIIIIGILTAILIAGSIMILGAQDVKEQFRWDEFWVGFTSFAFQMRFDVITVLFLLPVIFGLFVRSKNNKHANSILVLISGILLSAPLLTGMTDQTNQPYRFMPLVVFFAVGVGMLFSAKRI